MYFSSMHLLQPLCHLLIQDLTHTFSPFFLFLDLKHSGASRDSQLIVLPKSCFTECLCDLVSTDSPSLNRFYKQQVCDLSSACDQRIALLKKIVSDLIIVQFAVLVGCYWRWLPEARLKANAGRSDISIKAAEAVSPDADSSMDSACRWERRPALRARLAPVQTDPATIVLHPHQDLKPAIQLRHGNFAMHASRDA